MSARVKYAVAGSAARQAVDRVVALPDEDKLSPADWKVLCAVLYATVTWSRLVDRWPLEETQAMPDTRPLSAVAGLSVRQARRSLSKLSELGIVVYRAGRGAGNISVVGVPPEGEKADDYLSSLQDGESGHSWVGKADSTGSKKRPPTRARVNDEKLREDDEELRASIDKLGPSATQRERWLENPDLTRQWISAADKADRPAAFVDAGVKTGNPPTQPRRPPLRDGLISWIDNEGRHYTLDAVIEEIERRDRRQRLNDTDRKDVLDHWRLKSGNGA